MKNNNNAPQQGGNNTASGESQAGKSSPLDRYSVQPKQEEDESPYFKSAAPTISLPKGGGAIKGIDEKFSVNAINGTAGLEIGLPLTPGRGGFTPALSLNYNSGSGNSEFGLGWGLTLPSIQRKTDKKLPQYNDAGESDVFLLAGAEDLVPELDSNGERIMIQSGNFTIKRYRPRIEGLFARIEFIRQSGNSGSWWRVTTKDNITTYYGLDPASCIADPEEQSRIFKWLPDITVDHKGNVQQFFYATENLDNVTAAVYEKNRLNGIAKFTNTYLKRVCYGNLTPCFVNDNAVFKPTLPVTDWLFEAVLDYGDHSEGNYDPIPDRDWLLRSDPFSDFHAGFEIRTYRKCRRVLMFHHFAELNGGEPTLVKSLDLVYQNDDNPATATETDFIIEAEQTGYIKQGEGYYQKALPAMTFDYEPLQWNTQIQSVSREDFTGAPQGLTGPYQWTDFEGEGISGILTEQGNGWFYKNNLGDGHFESPKPIALKPSFTGLGVGLQWQDLDADGRRQVVAQAPIKGFWELDGPDAFTSEKLKWAPFMPFKKNINIDWNSPFTKSLDLDGDGKADVLITEDIAWTWYGNLGKEGFDMGGKAPVFRDEEKGPVLLLRDTVQSIFLADMNGDGMTDLVRIRNGEICYWPNKGYGRFGAKVTMQGAPVFQHPELFNPVYLTLADISGTGAADLIFTGRNKCTAWINLSGNAFAAPFDINPLPGTDQYSKLAILDFLGNGTGCIVWSSPLPHHATAPIQYIDLMGGKKPYLMKGYHSGTGKSVSVVYKSSTQFYLEDKLKGIRWATRLPFPVHCVQQIITEDVVSAATFTQSYKYRHGYYDHEEREYRGFGYVETLDIDKAIVSGNEDLDQKPVMTRTWYHTGAWIREASLLDRFRTEYFPFEGWDDVTKIADIPTNLNPQEQREAYRALKGSALRQEVYALDGTDKEGIPYTVTASAYEVKLIQALGKNRYASFINIQQQSIAFGCERNTGDPRIMHQLTLETDKYGNVLQSAQVAYKRKHEDITLPLKVREEQGKMHITCSQNTFTTDAIDDAQCRYYRLRLPYEAKSFEANVTTNEVATGALWTIASLKAAIDGAMDIPFEQPVAPNQKRLLSHSRTKFLKDDAAIALEFGILESLAIPYESYQLAFTNAMLESIYEGRVDEDAMLTENGYVETENYERLWIPSGRAGYLPDPQQNFYTPVAFTDPWNAVTLVSYNAYWLMPVSIEDAMGNITSIGRFNWSSLQPERITDPNNNVSEVLYDALGMPVAMALKGKDNGTEGDRLDGIYPDSPDDLVLQAAFMNDPGTYAGDLLQGATWRCAYDLNNLPVAVGMVARQHHVHNAVIPTGQNTEPVLRFSYSDGFGRVLMHKAQAEPTLENGSKEWLGSGRTIYNNKGNVVMQFEPYFSDNHFCDTAEQAAAQGVSPKLFYDALNRSYRTDLPDGTFTETDWTAWEQVVCDNNDTVLQSQWYIDRYTGLMGPEEQDAASKAEKHANTPTVMHTDTLARPFYTIQYLSPITDVTPDVIEQYVNLDIQGNSLSVVDGRGLMPLQYQYNMVQAVCRQISIDSGQQFTLMDVAGQPAFAWDPDNRLFAVVYDALHRPLRKSVQVGVLTTYMLERMEYGEGVVDDELHNLRGQLYRHYDGSGLQQVNDYDFKGNPIVTQQQLLEDPAIADVDWGSSPAPVLHAEVFTSASIMDALNRPVRMTDPGNNEHEYVYNRSGALKIVRLNGDPYVQDIHYDAKGQRQATWYGNGTKTGYTYDAQTFRLRRLLTVKLSTNEILQDLNYWYDPVGNITQINDGAQQTLFYANAIIDPTQQFTYDALYRLTEAKGREQIGTADFGAEDNYNDTAWKVNLGSDAAQLYVQQYRYDETGNILQLKHMAGTGSYTRDYNYSSSSNKLVTTEVGSWLYTYGYDVRGNMTAMPHLQAMLWNINNELHQVTKGANNTWYQYSGGQRIRKYTDKGSVKEERIYLGNYEIYRKFDASSSLITERTTVHVSDDTGRIAMLEVRTQGNAADDNNTDPLLTRYIYSNHLQSASLELNETADIISYEEYHPYGTTAYQASSTTINAVAKRYRYTGKERDEESGLYYHGARYYVPWLCRWCAVDPLESKYAGMSPYNYCENNPVMLVDPSGEGPGDPGDGDDKKPTGVWYYDKKDVLRFDKDHTYTDFPKGKGQAQGDHFFRLAGGQPGDKHNDGTYEHNADGTVTYHPPVDIKEFKGKSNNLAGAKKENSEEAVPTQIDANVPLVKISPAHVKALPVTNTKRQVLKPITEKIKVDPLEVKPQAKPLQPEAQKKETGSSGTLLSLIGMGLQYVETGLEGYKKNSWQSYAETAGEQWGNKIGGYLTKGVGWAGKGLGIFGALKSFGELNKDYSNPASWIKAGANVGMLFLKANPLALGIGIGFTILDEGGFIDKWFGNKK